MNKAPDLEKKESCCVESNGMRDTSVNHFLTLATKDEDDSVVHLYCAQRNPKYGFCWCCDDSMVFYVEELNGDKECGVHDGESNSDYPEEDAESFIENIQNNY